ncbi:MAG TPA: ATP synthase F0 subunit B [Planctomycetaceae bacterium]|nr:ATP synthase F0 subunit B [Planctomycetaceae bacterium]
MKCLPIIAVLVVASAVAPRSPGIAVASNGEEAGAEARIAAEGEAADQLVRRGVDADLGVSSAAGHASPSDAPHGTPNLNPLEWQSDLALWTGMVFVVLFLVLRKYAWKPIADGLDKREKGIASEISQAEQANRDAKQLLVEYQRKLDSATNEVRQMLQQARRDADKAGHEIVEAARREAKTEQDKALADIDQARDEALGDLAQRGAALAVELAGKIVKTELKPNDHLDLVQQAVHDFVQPNGGRKAK